MGEQRANDVLAQADAARARVDLARTFNPSGPVRDRELLQGRVDEIARVLSAVSQPGQHVILFGERGVGKTSLASLTHEFWLDFARDATVGIVPLRYNCEPADTFGTIWAHVAELLTDEYAKRGQPLPAGDAWLDLHAEITHEAASAHSVRRFLDLTNETSIIVIDEFDQVGDAHTIQQFASLIKALSDHLAPSTLILVGVADTVDDLIEDHASIDRATTQVALPRMSRAELRSIVENAYGQIGLSAAPELYDLMAGLAQGLPHYAHRMGQEAGFAAVERESLLVDRRDVDRAVAMAIEHTQESIRMAYRLATASPRPDALYDRVLLACALARSDELGYFAPSGVRAPLERVTGKAYDYPQFARHLKQFAAPRRGEVLQVSGGSRQRRYRFANPLLRPYVVLRGINDGVISADAVGEFEPRADAPPDGG